MTSKDPPERTGDQPPGRKPRRPNPVAKALATLKPKRIESEKAYKRRPRAVKPKGNDADETGG